MTVEYRKAASGDIKEIMSIVRNAMDGMTRHGIFQWDDLYPAKEDFQKDIEQGQLYVGTADGRIAVVYALNQECAEEYENGDWKYDGPFYVVHRLCVNPDFQNKGIAKRTLLHIETQLQSQGVSVIRLDVFQNNPFAVRLYDSLGYEKVGHADWRMGRFLLMEKQF